MGRGKVVDVTLRLVDKVTAPLNTVGGRLAQSADQWIKAGKQITRVGNNIANVGGTMTKSLTVPIVGLGTAAVKVAADFEAGMSNVKAICGTVSKDDLGSLEKAAKSMGIQFEEATDSTTTAMNILQEKAKEMGAKTKFSATEAAEAYSYMAMAGWKAEDMLYGIEPIMMLAGATNEELATTSDIVTDALTAFGMTSKDTQEMVDVLAATANNANTNVAMLGESFTYVAPVAGSMGYTIQDISLALGLMANSGIKASNAGTALRSTISRMAAPTKAVQSAMDALGITITNSDGTMKDFKSVMEDMRGAFGPTKISTADLTKGLEELEEAFAAGEITESEFDASQKKLMESAYGTSGALKAQYAAAIAGKTGMSGLLAIVNASDSDWDKLSNSITDAEGAAKRMYDVAQDNLQGQLIVLKSTVESIGISFGQKLTPYVKSATEFIQLMADKFNSLTDEQQNTIIKIGVIVASIGPAILIFGKIVASIGGMVTMIGKVGKAFKRFSSISAMLTSPAGIVIGIVAAIAAGAFLIIKNWDKIKPWLNEVKGWFVTNFGGAGGAFEKMKEAVVKVVNAIAPALKMLGTWLRENIPVAIEFLKKEFDKVKPVIENVLIKTINKAADIIAWLADSFAKAIPVITKWVKNVIGVWTPPFKKFIEIVKMVASQIKDVLARAFEVLGPIIKDTIPVIKDIAMFIGEKLIEAIKVVWPVLQNLGEMFAVIFEAMLERIQNFLKIATPVVSKIVKTVLSIVEKLRPAIAAAIEMISNNFKNFLTYVTTIFNGIMGVLNGIITFIKGVFSGNWKQAWEGVKQIFTSIFDTFAELAKKPINAVIGVINKAIGSLNKVNISIPGWVPGDMGGKSFGINIPKIPTLSVGTDNWKGGIVQISEKGGEIVDLPQGSRVYPHDESVRKAYADGANSKGNGRNVIINFPNFGQNITVRNEQDMKKLADQIVKMISEKLDETSDNMGGENIGYVY